MRSDVIDALLRERAGYVQRGLPARVALVDKELAVRGYKPARTVDPDIEVKADVAHAVPSADGPAAVRKRAASR